MTLIMNGVSRIQNKLSKISISKEDGNRKITCFCGDVCNRTIVRHMKLAHQEVWREWVNGFLDLRKEGLSYYSIIKRFRTVDGQFLFAARVVEREIQRLFEEGEIELPVPQKKKIENWQPKNFKISRETLWVFKNRGSWAVHQSDYRGNWSPYIPRTIIELYSNEGEIVVDPFVGGGTTLIEAWLTNRPSLGIDINPLAVRITRERIKEMAEKASNDPRIELREELRPKVVEGDSQHLKTCWNKSKFGEKRAKIALVHPPYLNSLKYTANIENDLSHLSDPTEFCDKLQKIAKDVFDLLEDDGTCAVLVGDVRREGKLLPIGFQVMERFMREKFELKDVVIKAQNKDSSTRYWYTRDNKLDFLIAHEYLFIFGKQNSKHNTALCSNRKSSLQK